MYKLLLVLFFISSPASAEIYKITLPDGSTGYSDTPIDGAVEITPPPLTPTPAVKYTKKPKPPVEDEAAKPLAYKQFVISSPADNATSFSAVGSLSVQVAIQPGLQTDYKHSLRLLLDGQPVKKEFNGKSITLKNIDRGSHTLTAQIIDEKQKVLKSSPSITVHIKRPSKLHKKTSGTWPDPTPLSTSLP